MKRREFVSNGEGEMKRREFISKVSRLGCGYGAYSLFPRWAWAGERAEIPHHFIMVRTFGGMDVTLGLDPQILGPGADAEDMFVEYRPDEIVESGGLRFAPSAKPLVPHASECLIVNGVMMRRDAGHFVNLDYMVTGRGDGKAAALPAELSLARGDGPFGLVASSGVYSAGKAFNVSSAQDLLVQADQENLTQWIEDRIEFLAAEQGTPLEVAEKQVVAAKETATAIQNMIEAYKKEGLTVDARHAIAAAFASGGSRHAQLDLMGPNLDTHSDHSGNHLRNQTQIWEEVSGLFRLFKRIPFGGGTLFDHTTFMVVSEWSRTPYLNAAKGKDHNPFTNSVLFAGRGIRKGTVVGKSRLVTRLQTGTAADHIAWPWNYKEQAIAQGPEGASFIFPENLVRTVGEIFGNPAGFHPVATGVQKISPILS